jgi:HEPN domain-containing protein
LKFEHNFANALDFHECAAYLHENNSSRLTGFMLHQAVELTFRGILQSLNGYHKKTYEIRVLKKYARRCAPQLCRIFSDDSEGEKHILDILEGAYSNSRYVDDYDISEGHFNVLFEKVLLLQDMARKVVHSVLKSSISEES